MHNLRARAVSIFLKKIFNTKIAAVISSKSRDKHEASQCTEKKKQ